MHHMPLKDVRKDKFKKYLRQNVVNRRIAFTQLTLKCAFFLMLVLCTLFITEPRK